MCQTVRFRPIFIVNLSVPKYMDIDIERIGVVRARWWVPAVATPLGTPLLAVPLAALAARGRRNAGDNRVSMETAHRALAYVTSTYGLLMVSEALHFQRRDYMRERDTIGLREACFPTARQDGSGHAVTVVPVALLPLVLACFANRWPPARDPAAVAAFIADIAAHLPQEPHGDAYRLYVHLMRYVSCTDIAQVPAAIAPDYEPPTHAAARVIDVLDYDTLVALVVELIMTRRTTIEVAPLHIDASAQPLLDALRQSPFQITFSD